MFAVIIEPAEITECDFSVTPGQMIDLAPTQTPSSIIISFTIRSNVSFLYCGYLKIYFRVLSDVLETIDGYLKTSLRILRGILKDLIAHQRICWMTLKSLQLCP